MCALQLFLMYIFKVVKYKLSLTLPYCLVFQTVCVQMTLNAC